MSTEIKPWTSEIEEVGVANELENILALNFHDMARLKTHEILIELSKNLKQRGNSAVIYGVGNIGFKFTHHWNPIATDGKIEGHSNDPANDHDFVVVTNSNFESFKPSVNSAILSVRKRHATPNNDDYNHWTKLGHPKWNDSNFKIPPYCSVNYKWHGNNQKEHTQMEIHWLENQPHWEKIFLSKYAPWYSTHIGFPIIQASVVNDKLHAGVWQPFHKEIDLENTHEVRIAAPEAFGDDARDILQTVRITFALVQSTIGANRIATFSEHTKKILTEGVKKSATQLDSNQKKNATSRLKTALHRAVSLNNEMDYYCKIEDITNPFEGYSSPENMLIDTLDEIGWGKQVLGVTVKEFLS